MKAINLNGYRNIPFLILWIRQHFNKQFTIKLLTNIRLYFDFIDILLLF